jgi:aminopeptidase
MDPRNRTLAKQIVSYSLDLKRGESLLIEAHGSASRHLVREIAGAAADAGANVYVNLLDDSVLRRILLASSEAQIEALATYDVHRMKNMQCYVAIRGADNVAELGDVPREKIDLYQRLYQQRVHADVRVPGTRWVVLRYPNHAMAQLAGRSVEGFADHYYDVCTLDYARMSRAMDPLAALMDRTDRVEIEGPHTHLSFSIAGIPSVKCDGHINIPDGEIFTAPVRESVEGRIFYNCATLYQGTMFPSISLVFESGRVVEAETDGDADRLHAILDTDVGARSIGEFAIGFNPFITEPILDILFDEKIAGSIHTALGQAYENADNGNRSAIHWDLVHSQRPEAGGGEIRFDGRVIRKDGLFVLPELEGLNPDSLRG